jgi:hypothetical protein
MLFVMQLACKAMCKMLIGIESGFELAVIIWSYFLNNYAGSHNNYAGSHWEWP